jgi:hypothetical protein
MTEKTSAPKRKTATAKAPVARGAAAKKPVAVKPEKPGKKTKKAAGDHADSKVKVVRDSFTMPQRDYAKIAELKQTCLKAGLQVKKSELLRAGLQALCDLSVPQLKLAITRMEQIKTGRPRKS